MGDDMIRRDDAALCIDVTCYGCKRTVALSNCEQYCHRCAVEKLPLDLLVRQLMGH